MIREISEENVEVLGAICRLLELAVDAMGDEIKSLTDLAKGQEEEIDSLLFKNKCKEEEIDKMTQYIADLEKILILSLIS